MPTIFTLGTPSRRAEFTYDGSVVLGVSVHYNSSQVFISAEFFQMILNQFRGSIVPGGFSMDNPIPGGLGEWILQNSSLLNPMPLTPRHASHIAGILWNEGYLQNTWIVGKKVMLRFNIDY